MLAEDGFVCAVARWLGDSVAGRTERRFAIGSKHGFLLERLCEEIDQFQNAKVSSQESIGHEDNRSAVVESFMGRRSN
jgi:hypothetical protein